jgi:zinc/manganese transport system substrate-binding protein
MKKILLITLLFTSALLAQVNVTTTYAYLGEVTKKVGGDLVHVDVLASSKNDPHFIVPKPSLISKLSKSDLLIINGGQLEIGWLPPLLRAAQNRKINLGQKGFLDVSGAIKMINKPAVVSRSFGDVHPDGNPHFGLDPYNMLPLAQLITMKLSQIDPIHQQEYKANLNTFTKEWQAYLKTLDAKMAVCNDKKVVQYHQLFNYFLQRYNIQSFGTIEPLPGITPSSKHTLELIAVMKENGVKKILQDVYHERKTAKFIASKTGAKVLVIPHDVGADGSKTLEEFYDKIAQRICQ